MHESTSAFFDSVEKGIPSYANAVANLNLTKFNLCFIVLVTP